MLYSFTAMNNSQEIGHERLPSTKRQVEIETETPRHSPGADFLWPADCFLHTCLVGATYCCSVGVDLPPYSTRETSTKNHFFAEMSFWIHLGQGCSQTLKRILKCIA